ncbi:hypothetical protein IV38_GL001621 [Lactobacillus selangorensis]|uniref:PTS EIIB type-3 domain-containing protein n=2 Tax=Lactobacillus selangorensis TaxID=81857 RepID=A0A0R2FHQ3_9LACO|nr:hypothetical protein IV38_GL001621 [Lactobacillus selangorensis]KRN30955.1 hypothetical protein IV40_GL001594 [Lactobacillus selangorensis]
MLVKKMQDAAEKDGVSYKIFATSSADVTNQLSKPEDDRPDILMLGPQIAYMQNDMQKKADKVGIPMAMINMQDYGMMNGEKVLQAAEKLLGDK